MAPRGRGGGRSGDAYGARLLIDAVPRATARQWDERAKQSATENKKPSHEDWAFCLKLDGAGKKDRPSNFTLFRLWRVWA